MTRLTSSLLLIALLLATAPTADAQLGGLLNRAKRAISGDSSTETAPEQTPEAAPVSQNASPPGSSAASRASLPDGSTAPVLDMFDLLTMTYNARNGLIKPHELTLVFPIGEHDSRNAVGEYILRDVSGAVVFRRALRETTSLTPTFRTLQSTELAFGPLAAGTYTTEVTYKDLVVGRFPFTVEERNVGDAYSPRMLRIRDGAWRTLGLFEHPTDRRTQALLFSCWLHPDDVGPERTNIRFELTRDGEFVADSKMVLGSLNGWTLAQHELRDLSDELGYRWRRMFDRTVPLRSESQAAIALHRCLSGNELCLDARLSTVAGEHNGRVWSEDNSLKCEGGRPGEAVVFGTVGPERKIGEQALERSCPDHRSRTTTKFQFRRRTSQERAGQDL